jgi:hypothetical protein
MAKKKIVEAQDGLKNVAVAVGSALGKLAAKLGVAETPAATAPVVKKSRPSKKVVAKKTAAKRTTAKKTTSRVKRASK